MLTLLLAAGLVLSTATQLRAPDLPLGIGEALLVLWMGVVLLRQRSLRVASHVRPFVYFFIAVVVLLSIANVLQVERTGEMPPEALHDTIAYVFLTALMVTFGLARPSVFDAYLALRTIVVLAVGLFSLLLLLSLQVEQIGGFILATGPRFVGLSNNPNQLGMLLAPLPFLCLYFLWRAPHGRQRLGFLVLLPLSIWIGLATSGDAVVVVWISGALLLVFAAFVLKVQRWLIGRAIGLNQAMFLANLLLVGFAFAILVLVSPSVAEFAEDVVTTVEEGDEGSRRILLWTSGLAKLGDSPLVGFVGFGGGPQVEDVMFEKTREAHNSYIDFALSTGLLGFICLIALIVVVVVRNQLLLQPVLLAAFASLLGFGFFHYVFRHPIFWFYMVLLVAVAHGERVVPQRRPRPREAVTAAAA